MSDDPLSLSKLDVEFNLLNPSLILHQHDLVWWIDYVRRLNLHESFKSETNMDSSIQFLVSDKTALTPQQFADDFSRDFLTHQIEKVLKQQTSNQFLLDHEINSLENNALKKSSLKLHIQLGLTDFECQLKSVDGAAIFFGIELATFDGNNVCYYVLLLLYQVYLDNRAI